MDDVEFLRDAVTRLGFLSEPGDFACERLPGGVSSDIWRVDLPGGPICVKRALGKLNVAIDWRVPVRRNAFEVAWFRTVAEIEPTAVPAVLAHDPEAGLFAMPYLDPAAYRLWKGELAAGRADAAIAGEIGRRLGRIHSATAGDLVIATGFPTDDIFRAIRLDAYFETTACRHPDLGDALRALSRYTLGQKRALVHGDISPKNIMIGPDGPVFLDAECAWYGDPAFDIAFCLNHLLLKCLWVPRAARDFLNCFDALAENWLADVDWEARADADARAATLLPGLFLGRIDGKSPVEYLTDDADRDRVRGVARALLDNPVDTLSAVRNCWAKELRL